MHRKHIFSFGSKTVDDISSAYCIDNCMLYVKGDVVNLQVIICVVNAVYDAQVHGEEANGLWI